MTSRITISLALGLSGVVAAFAACGSDASGPATVVCASACDTPPAATCLEDAATLRSFASPGVCGADAQCSYGHVDFACEAGCEAGACKGVVDPCAEVVCVEPPPARCDGDTLETFASLGTCEDGACSYASVPIACANGCADGACAGDPCQGVVCDDPPSPCHAAAGTCSSGVCSYAVLVGAACDDGVACSEDDTCSAAGTCAGTAIACQSAPAPVCDGATLRVSAATGTCADGVCSYDVTEVACPEGCQAGACLGDPCEGVVCDDPPSPCHAATGTCESGVCAYAFDNGAACDDGDACSDDDRCHNGVCAGAERACTTPDAPACKDDQTLVARGASGTCDAGACSYVAIEVPCAFGCVTVDGSGRCLGDPCGGVVCDAPAPAACANTTSLVVPAATGICAGGNCNYDTVVFTCAHGCEAGTGGAPAACKPPRGLTVSEIVVDTQGFPDRDAFIEVHGPPNLTVEGLALVAVNGNGGADYAHIALTGALDSQGLYLVTHPESASALLADLTDTEADLQNGPDSVQLRYGDVVLDALAYGEFDADDVAAGEGAPAAVAPVGQGIARDGDYADTDDNAADFAARVATPAAPNEAPEVPPAVVLDCAAEALVGASALFDASASTGDIARFTFDFGDATTPADDDDGLLAHAYAAAGTFTVKVTATSPRGLTDDATCDVVVSEPPVETPVTYDGDEQCFSSSSPPAYLDDVLSNPPDATTDGHLTVRFKGTSPYGPKPYVLELQTGADTWVEVAKTNPSKATIYQTENFRVPQATLQAAIDAMGWLRIRHGYQYNGASEDCVEVDLQYNCEACFACPAGEEDLGIGCRPIADDYDYTAFEHATGQCGAYDFSALYLPGAPPAAGDGTFSIEFLGCDATNIALEIYTANSDWIDVGQASATSCTFGKGTWQIPEAFLDQAIDEEHRILFRWSLDDSCAAGVGCASFNDPCVRNARLTYPR